MNSTFAVISILIKSNIEEKRLINFWMNVSTKGLKYYLECASTSKGDHLWRKQVLLKWWFTDVWLEQQLKKT